MPNKTEIIKTTFERMVPYMERAFCECGGELKSTGESFWNGSGSWLSHKCDKCPKTLTIKNAKYPRLVHRPESWTPPTQPHEVTIE